MKTQLSQTKKPYGKKEDDEEASQGRAESQAAAVPSPPAWEPGDGPGFLTLGKDGPLPGNATLSKCKHCFWARATKKCLLLIYSGKSSIGF